MLIINDIELINGLRILKLLNIGEFCFSDFYMHDNYLSVVERQSLKTHAENYEIVLFESGSDFFEFYGECDDECPITMPGLSSVYYAKKNNMPLVTICPATKAVAEKYGVTVYDYTETFKNLNAQQAQLDYLMKVILMMNQQNSN